MDAQMKRGFLEICVLASLHIFPWQCPRTSAGIAFRNKRARFNHEVVDALYYAPYSIGRREVSWMLK